MGTRFVTAGPGDPRTWGPCTGHPNDPRTDVDAENEAFENWATDQYKDCPYELALLECAFNDYDKALLPEKYVKEGMEEKDGSDVVFFLFPYVVSPLKDLLASWAEAIDSEEIEYAQRKIEDILFVYGQEQLVKATEQSHRGAVSDMLEELFYGDKEAAYGKSAKLFRDVSREIAEGELINEAEDLYLDLEKRWNQRGRYEYGRPDYD